MVEVPRYRAGLGMGLFLALFLLSFLLRLNWIGGGMDLLPFPQFCLGWAIKARLEGEVGKLVIWVSSLIPIN